jgi:hypothetical protein
MSTSAPDRYLCISKNPPLRGEVARSCATEGCNSLQIELGLLRLFLKQGHPSVTRNEELRAPPPLKGEDFRHMRLLCLEREGLT